MTARSREGECMCTHLLPCLCLAWSLHSCTVQDPSPGEWCCQRWAGSLCIHEFSQFPRDMPTGQCYAENPSFRLSFQVILSCIKLTIRTVTVTSLSISRSRAYIRIQEKIFDLRGNPKNKQTKTRQGLVSPVVACLSSRHENLG